VTRPVEYENLIKRNYFEVVAPTAGAVEGFLRNAGEYLSVAKGLDPAHPLQIFTMAYEGYFQVVHAILEFYEIRTKDAGRNMAFQRVSTDLNVNVKEFTFITKAHARRNGTSYHSPFPPVSKAEALAMVAILEKNLPKAYAHTGKALPT